MKEEENILLTVAIPTYNRKKYLKECLEHLIPQITDHIEVIVSDNGSTDDTPQLMSGYTEKYSFIRYYRIKKTARIKNPLKRYRMAKGKFLFVLCDDDIPLRGCIENIMNCIKREPDVSLICMNTCNFSKNFTNVISSPNLKIKEDLYTYDKDEFLINVGIWITFISCLVYKIENLKKVSDPESYYRNGFSINHIALLSTKGNVKLAVFKDICVAARGGNNARSYDIYDMFVKNLHILLFTSGIEAGYSKKALDKVYVNSITTMVRNFIMEAKRGNTIYFLKDKRKLIMYTYRYPKVWLRVYPYVFIPFLK